VYFLLKPFPRPLRMAADALAAVIFAIAAMAWIVQASDCDGADAVPVDVSAW